MYDLFFFFKVYPNDRQLEFYTEQDRRNKKRLLNQQTKYLAETMNEVNQRFPQRFSDANKIPHIFPPLVAASVDTFPVYVNRPKSSIWQKKLYNGKYKGHVIKVQ